MRCRPANIIANGHYGIFKESFSVQSRASGQLVTLCRLPAMKMACAKLSCRSSFNHLLRHAGSWESHRSIHHRFDCVDSMPAATRAFRRPVTGKSTCFLPESINRLAWKLMTAEWHGQAFIVAASSCNPIVQKRRKILKT